MLNTMNMCVVNDVTLENTPDDGGGCQGGIEKRYMASKRRQQRR